MSTPSNEAKYPSLSVLARQQTFNRRTRANSALFEPHRRRVTGTIVAASRVPAGHLCVLGAGNANDLDLPVLARAFDQTHLVDLDPEALWQAAERHPELDPVVRLHSGVDLSGIATQLDNIDHPPRAEQIGELITAARNVPTPRLAEPYEVVASTCLLTQLMNASVAAVGETEPRLLELLAAIRIGHLRLLANMVAPGGTGLLFTDIASSDDVPEIATTSDPSRLVAELTRRKKMFVGIDPQQIEDDLRYEPLIAPRIEALTPIGVWPWRINETRTFLVSGISFRIVPGKNLK